MWPYPRDRLGSRRGRCCPWLGRPVFGSWSDRHGRPIEGWESSCGLFAARWRCSHNADSSPFAREGNTQVSVWAAPPIPVPRSAMHPAPSGARNPESTPRFSDRPDREEARSSTFQHAPAGNLLEEQSERIVGHVTVALGLKALPRILAQVSRVVRQRPGSCARRSDRMSDNDAHEHLSISLIYNKL